MALKWTNKHNLPAAFVNAVINDQHVNSGDISVTQLIDAPQIRQLKRLHDYEMDVMDLVPALLGTGLHTLLERGMQGTFNYRHLQRAIGVLTELGEDRGVNYLKKVITEKLGESIETDLLVEQNLTIEVNGYTISGTFDRFTQSLRALEDYKTTTASQVAMPGVKKSWSAQQNIYAVMILDNLGLRVKSADIIAFIKDWSKMKLNTSRDYPRTPIVMVNIPIIEESKVRKYIESRVELHKRADNGESIPCTPNERWANPDIYAVMAKGGKRSKSNNLTEQSAIAWIESNKAKFTTELFVEKRPGGSFRCANGYCPVSDVCPQYQKEKELAAINSEELK